MSIMVYTDWNVPWLGSIILLNLIFSTLLKRTCFLLASIIANMLVRYKSNFTVNLIAFLTLIWVGFLGVRFEVDGRGKTTPCLKPVRIMLQTSNLARMCTPIYSFGKYTFQCLDPLNFADVSIFLQKVGAFCPKIYLYSKQQCESCV